MGVECSWIQLSRLTGLTSLVLSAARCYTNASNLNAIAGDHAARAALLEAHRTYDVHPSVPALLSSLPHLAQLKLLGAHGDAISQLAAQPTALRLHLTDSRSRESLNIGHLTRLTRLHTLMLAGAPQSVLQHLDQLNHIYNISAF